jgi:hypothetical protein
LKDLGKPRIGRKAKLPMVIIMQGYASQLKAIASSAIWLGDHDHSVLPRLEALDQNEKSCRTFARQLFRISHLGLGLIEPNVH